jgi:hypothetical protein
VFIDLPKLRIIAKQTLTPTATATVMAASMLRVMLLPLSVRGKPPPIAGGQLGQSCVTSIGAAPGALNDL